MVKEKKVNNKEKFLKACPANDVIFKSIFINEVDILLKMIFDIIDIKDFLSADVIVPGYEVEPYKINGKTNKSDMLVRSGTKYLLNLEINYTEGKYILKRNLVQLFKISNQIGRAGEKDKDIDIELLGQLNINNFHNENNRTLMKILLMDPDTLTEVKDGIIKIWNLNIAKCYEIVYNNIDEVKKLPKMERWGAILKTPIKDIEFIEKIIGDDLLTMEEKKRFIGRVKALEDNDRIVEEWMVADNNRLREKGEIDFAKNAGFAQGIEQGIESKGKDVIINMLKKEFDYKTIAEITNKDIKDIKLIEKEAFK